MQHLKTIYNMKNTVFVRFSDGQNHKFKTSKTIPEIRNDFRIGSSFLLSETNLNVKVESLTIN